MPALSTYLKGKLVDHVLRGSASTMPAGLYLALHTADPTIAGTVGELTTATYTTYARQVVAFNAISTATTINTSTVTFPAFVGADQTVTHWSIKDASSLVTYNTLLFGALTAAKTLQATDVPSFPAGALQITWN